MLLTIHNLPSTTRYPDIKSLLQSKCGLQHVILDNLIRDGGGKKVTVGVAEDADAAILVRKINGLYWNGQQLYVEDVRQQKPAAEQPFRSANFKHQEPEPNFHSVNLQQHSSYNQLGNGMANNMNTLPVPLKPMYYAQDCNSEKYVKSSGYVANSYVQGQNFKQVTQKVQSAYMGISGYTQTAKQVTQVGLVPQYNNTQQNFPQSEYQRSRWDDNYNEEQDFVGEWPQGSVNVKRESNWMTNQQNRQQESPPRDRSSENRVEPWVRGSDDRAQPDFWPTRTSDRSGFENDPPRQTQFSRNSYEFSGRKYERGRSNEREEFSERPSAFVRSNELYEPLGFSERANERHRRPNEFAERKERSNNRPVTWRPNDRSEFNRPHERGFKRSNNRTEFSRDDSDHFGNNERRPRPDFPDSRKRNFVQRFEEKHIDRPERLSRPKRARQPSDTFKNPGYPGNDRITSDGLKAKLSSKMLLGGLRKIIYEIKQNVDSTGSDISTRQTLRKLVTSRMMEILNGRTMVPPLECFSLYRTKYPDSGDKETYASVLAMVAKQKAHEAVGYKTEDAVESEQDQAEADSVPMGKLTKVVKNAKKWQKVVKLIPQKDKKQVAQDKKKKIDSIIPDMEPAYKTAMEEEINNLINVFLDTFNNPPTSNDQRVYNAINQSGFVMQIKKNLTHTLSRRITDSGLKVVRIFGDPILPKQEDLEKFLQHYGVMSIRNSNKSYTASVDTYKNYDILCSRGPVDFAGGITLTFKPFHFVPNVKAEQQQHKTSQIDINLLDKDWPAKEAEIMEKQAIKDAAIAQQSFEMNKDETSQDDNQYDAKKVYLNEDFHIIDEVNESDSDVEYTGGNNEVINVDEDTNDVEIIDSNEAKENIKDVLKDDIKDELKKEVKDKLDEEIKDKDKEQNKNVDDDYDEVNDVIEDNEDDADIDNIDVDIDDFEDY